MKVIKKPLIANAWKLPSLGEGSIHDIFPDDVGNQIDMMPNDGAFTPVYAINTLPGFTEAGVGDYLLQGVHGELWFVKKEIFEADYEIVEGKP